MAKLTGKVAVVTGASKGIGAEIAKALAAEGAAVVVNYSSSQAGAERVVNEIVAQDGRAIAVAGDVSQASDVARLFAEAKRAFGRVDIVVNNAGVYRFDPLSEVTEDEFHRQFNTNVLGPILVSKQALLDMEPEGGSIINVGSAITRSPGPGSVVYAATKHALEGVTATLAQELGARQIRVNAINPGPVETEGVHAAGLAGSDFMAQMVAKTPLGRIGQPQDIAPLAVFLASDDSSWMTGETLSATGGMR
jgi:3-oxoacyl-[acyl-carrier protein] reductase